MIGALMGAVTTCGVLLFQHRPRRSFLVLVREERLDLPKGRKKRGEGHLACALRELEEETGIAPSAVRIVEDFRFDTIVRPGTPREKRVVLFAAEVVGPVRVCTPEHDDYAWVPWDPPHELGGAPLIHQVLSAWERHIEPPARGRASSPQQRKAS